jgi:hypothetical protein
LLGVFAHRTIGGDPADVAEKLCRGLIGMESLVKFNRRLGG